MSNVGTEGAALTQSQRAEYIDTIEKLAPFDISLREAVDLLLPMLKARRQTVPMQVAIIELLDAKKANTPAAATWRTYAAAWGNSAGFSETVCWRT